jgi:farnesyl diphosphate synthase
MLDLAAEHSAEPLSVAAIAELQAMKTGALLTFSVEAGTRLAGATAASSAALSNYGGAIGAAFQIADDILDAEGDAATLGKRVRKDAERNKATLVGALGLEGARRELVRLVEEAESAVDKAGVGAAGDALRATARFIAMRKN